MRKVPRRSVSDMEPVNILTVSSSLESSDLGARGRTFVVPKQPDEELDNSSLSESFDEPISDASLEQVIHMVNQKFEAKEKQIKMDMREEFEMRLKVDRKDQAETMKLLKRDLSNLTKVSEECENLKDIQRIMRRELQGQQDKMLAITKENQKLKNQTSSSETTSTENQKLKAENDKLKRENERLELQMGRLAVSVQEKEKEINGMKMLVDAQYKKLKLDLTNTRDKFHNEQETLQEGMKKQQLMLSEISETVKTFSKGNSDSDPETKSTTRASTKPLPHRRRELLANVKSKSFSIRSQASTKKH